MSKKKISYHNGLVVALILVLFCCTLAFALTPEINSIEPDNGANDSPTAITVDGANFEPIPEVALYGGGPYTVGSADTPDHAWDVYVSGNYAYVADGYSGLLVIDVSDPTSPTIVGSADTPGNAGDVFVSGNYAYVADGISGLQVIDISDPTIPTIVGSVDTPSDASARGVYVSGNYAYVADEWAGLQVLRTFEPCSNITFVNSTTLTATVPPGLPIGTYNLHVTNPNPERAILYNSFTVTEGDGSSGDGNGDGGGGGGFG